MGGTVRVCIQAGQCCTCCVHGRTRWGAHCPAKVGCVAGLGLVLQGAGGRAATAAAAVPVSAVARGAWAERTAAAGGAAASELQGPGSLPTPLPHPLPAPHCHAPPQPPLTSSSLIVHATPRSMSHTSPPIWPGAPRPPPACGPVLGLSTQLSGFTSLCAAHAAALQHTSSTPTHGLRAGAHPSGGCAHNRPSLPPLLPFTPPSPLPPLPLCCTPSLSAFVPHLCTAPTACSAASALARARPAATTPPHAPPCAPRCTSQPLAPPLPLLALAPLVAGVGVGWCSRGAGRYSTSARLGPPRGSSRA